MARQPATEAAVVQSATDTVDPILLDIRSAFECDYSWTVKLELCEPKPLSNKVRFRAWTGFSAMKEPYAVDLKAFGKASRSVGRLDQ